MKIASQAIGFLFLLLFSTTVQSKPVIQRVWAFNDSVGQYEKFEAQIDLEAKFTNPYDPDEIDIMATFRSPAGKEWKIPVFYNYTWTFWMVRFSSGEIGEWTYQITVKDQEGQAVSEPDTFTVIPSQYHGPIRVASNQRYLEYADGTPYYGVGLWYNSGLHRRSRGKTPPEELDELKALGVNFISTILTPLETIGSGVGRYDQEICGRLDQLLEWCEERDILLSLNLWFHSFLSETVWPGGNRRWHTNPYKYICKAKDFYSSQKAWTYQEKLYRYIIARWAYSRSLGIWFIVDEVNGTDGWVSGDSLGAARWGKKVHDFFKANDPFGHPTTGTRSGGIIEFWHEGYQIFDLAAREIYEAQGFPILKDGKIDPGDAHPLRLSYLNYVNEIRKLWNGYEKPAIIGETGWDHTFYEPGMPGYLALYHNALWGSLASGLAMTPFWWSYSRFVNDNVVTRQMTNIAQFTREIPFSKLTQIMPMKATLSGGDAFAMKSDQLIFGWVVKPEADVAGAKVTLFDLPDAEYKLRIYHTWRGQFFHEEKISSTNGAIEFSIPILKIEGSHARYVGQDVAFVLKMVE